MIKPWIRFSLTQSHLAYILEALDTILRGEVRVVQECNLHLQFLTIDTNFEDNFGD